MHYSFSNTLIVFACIVTFFALFINPSLFIFWINDNYYSAWLYHVWILQFFSAQLLHGSSLHLLFNMIFVGYFWNIIERTLWYQNMCIFFVLTSVFLWLSITFLSAPHSNTVWMSWFAMAILTYYTLELYSIKHPDYRGGITVIVINVLIWFMPNISLLWHAWGVVFWILFWYGYYLYKKYIYFRM